MYGVRKGITGMFRVNRTRKTPKRSFPKFGKSEDSLGFCIGDPLIL